MIDEKKLIEDLFSKMPHQFGAQAMEWFRDLIKEQPKISEWIPAEEPPENGKYVLLSFANFSVPLVGRYEEDEEGGAYYVGDDTDSCVSQYIIVNAWQPLPEPYKELD